MEDTRKGPANGRGRIHPAGDLGHGVKVGGETIAEDGSETVTDTPGRLSAGDGGIGGRSPDNRVGGTYRTIETALAALASPATEVLPDDAWLRMECPLLYRVLTMSSKTGKDGKPYPCDGAFVSIYRRGGQWQVGLKLPSYEKGTTFETECLRDVLSELEDVLTGRKPVNWLPAKKRKK